MTTNEVPATTDRDPLAIIAPCPPSRRRRSATTSCTIPATTAQAPHTRSTAGTPEVRATASPAAASALRTTLTYSPGATLVTRDERASTTAAATSNSG